MFLTAGDIVKILLPISSESFDYIVQEDNKYKIGDIVFVNFKNKKLFGVIIKKNTESITYDKNKIKPIISSAKNYSLQKNHLDFIFQVANYNMTLTGNILHMMIGFKEIFTDIIPKKKNYNYTPTYISPKLSKEQENASNLLKEKLNKGFSTTLIDGITGSGKTEVYFNVINEALLQNNTSQILILLPEISLTGQFLLKFKERFGIEPVLWHSTITTATRRDNWKAIINGTARVIVGTRSALFLPFKNLSLIVLDEEHDISYKQEDKVIYQARDMAILKASIDKIPIILASATPSIETINNINLGKYESIKLTSRFGTAVIPNIDLIDMRINETNKNNKNKGWISNILVKAITEKLLNKEQVMLYINRRGYAPLVLCEKCGDRLTCPNCNVYLTAHNKDNTKCHCHHCGYNMPLPKICKKCSTEHPWVLCGPGIERIEEEVKNRFPNAKIAVISSDIITSQSRLNNIITEIINNNIDIIIGTQIVVKGHHFPNLTLVGVIDGDMSLSSSDLRANENTFQILTQVSGRAGRDSKKGIVLIQTYNPDNPVMTAIKNNDRDSFIESELKDRKLLQMPPFSKLAAVILSSKNKINLDIACELLKKQIPTHINNLTIYGPIDAPLSYIKNTYRKRFLMIADKKLNLQFIIKKWKENIKFPYNVMVKIDIDPYNFM